MAIVHRAHLQNRLQSILSSIDRSASEPFFYTKQFEKEKSLSLIAIFDNGIDPDPAFSGSIMGRIYLDEESNLCLVSWPISKAKERPWRKEVLFPKVKSFEFEFLGKKGVEEGKEKVRAITPNLVWKSSWAKNERQIPGIIRLMLTEEGNKEPIRYAFILPTMEPFVTYRERAI